MRQRRTAPHPMRQRRSQIPAMSAIAAKPLSHPLKLAIEIMFFSMVGFACSLQAITTSNSINVPLRKALNGGIDSCKLSNNMQHKKPMILTDNDMCVNTFVLIILVKYK